MVASRLIQLDEPSIFEGQHPNTAARARPRGISTGACLRQNTTDMYDVSWPAARGMVATKLIVSSSSGGQVSRGSRAILMPSSITNERPSTGDDG
ncbi:hypothetical protein ACCO45_008302 [Purpureocillium lilacinum]|uniref:Uncharacterized protein n=1 Tax=Purpureocillium lilacinum TaxID=33203 RepID=A0ACC4DN50_PURLI